MKLKLYRPKKLKRLPLWQCALMATMLVPLVPIDLMAENALLGTTEQRKINITVRGKVVDEKGIGLPGVSVQIKGTALGAVTDAGGLYAISIPDNLANKSLTFSYIGYVSQDVAIGGNTSINVQLKVQADTQLDDVVVVGYGVQRRGSITGAVNTIDAKNIENKPVLNVFQALQGEAPNLIIQQRNLNPGSDVTVNIRGVGTLGSNAPLVVIDGIIGGNLGTLNPNDVASITVLKDAGSAAIYGSRAANGVILVTTKSGSLNQKTAVSYNGSYGIQDANVLLHKVSGWENAYYKNESLVNSGLGVAYTAEQIQQLKDQGDGTWDIRTLLRTAPQQSHNVSVTGGGENSSYYISAGYQDQGSNFIGNGGSGANFGYQKFNLRLNQTNVIGKLRTNFILLYTKTRNKTNSVGDNNIFADANRVPLNFSFQDENGNYLTNAVAGQYNEYGVLEKGGFNQADNDEIFGTFNGQFSITKDLKLTGEFGGTLQNNGTFYRRAQVDFLPSGVYGDDRAVLDGNSKSQLFNTKLFLEYGKRIAAHDFSAQIGASSENYSQRGFQLQKTLTDPLLGTATTGTLLDAVNSTNSLAIASNSLLSLIGRLKYSYQDKYLFEAVGRYDASSKFARGNRASFFPSVNLGWILTQESFMESIKSTVSNLKLRATYGVLGNQNVDNFQYQTTYFNYASAYGFNNVPVGGTGTLLSNKDLTWEKASTLNIGVDAGFFENRLTASFEVYNKVTRDILQPRRDIPAIFGAATPDYNVAKVRSYGWEATVAYNLRGENVTHSFSANLADNQNELLKLSGGATEQIQPQDVFQLLRRIGEPVTQYYGYKTNGFFQNQADITNSPKIAGNPVVPGDVKFKDLNNDGIIDAKDNTTLGNPFPRYTFGFTYRLAVKGFDFQLFVQGVGKRDAFLRGELVEPFHYGYGASIFEHMTDTWSPSNPDARYPIYANIGSPSNTNNWRTGSDLYKYNAAYARVKNINIGYTLAQAVSKKFGVERFRISLIGQNLFTFSKLKFIDPETSEFGNDVSIYSASNSVRQYPLPVFYGAGLDITF